MPKQIPGKAVVDAVVLGISNAQYDYEKLSGGDWVWMAAEYWITTYVAKEIGKIPGAKLVTIESSAKQTMKDAGGSRPPYSGSKPRRYTTFSFWEPLMQGCVRPDL